MKTTFKTYPRTAGITNASAHAIGKTLPTAGGQLSPNDRNCARRSGGGALLLVLAALLLPAPASAAVCTDCYGE